MDVKEAGKKGGEKTQEKYGDEHFKRISKLGVEARKLKAKLLLDNQAVDSL